MSTSIDIIEHVLNSGGSANSLQALSGDIEPGEISSNLFREPGYTGEIDYRIRQLSYSSNLLLHSCPRKFELYKKRTTYRELEREEATITFTFGAILGEAIQLSLQGVAFKDIVWKMFLDWNADLFAEDEKRGKSFWAAVLALKRFEVLRAAGFLQDYELVYFQDKPACELSFAINLPDGFRYRGFVDAVLRHKITGEIIVLECKTTWHKTVSPSQYKNSAQAIGYSIVLDHIFPALSSYKVLYLIYQTLELDYIQIPFPKSYLQRALWIKDVLFDVESIKMYEREGYYPMRGESCYSFGHDCEYINHCTMSTEYLVKPSTEKDLDTTEYQVNISLLDLLETQLEKLG